MEKTVIASYKRNSSDTHFCVAKTYRCLSGQGCEVFPTTINYTPKLMSVRAAYTALDLAKNLLHTRPTIEIGVAMALEIQHLGRYWYVRPVLAIATHTEACVATRPQDWSQITCYEATQLMALDQDLITRWREFYDNQGCESYGIVESLTYNAFSGISLPETTKYSAVDVVRL